jgi:hypothetical protein
LASAMQGPELQGRVSVRPGGECRDKVRGEPSVERLIFLVQTIIFFGKRSEGPSPYLPLGN